MPKHLIDLAADYRTLAATYTESAKQLRTTLEGYVSPYFQAQQQELINQAEARAAELNQRADEITKMMTELAWWRAEYPKVEPEGA